MAETVVGIDVGTASVRAGLFDLEGTMLASATCPIDVYRDGDFAEQSSAQIWDACATVVRECVEQSQVAPGDVVGLACDATCSLVVLDKENQPLTASITEHDNRNVILWMDHRAKDIAAAINAQGHAVLHYVGNRISPEMETPKLKWLKENLPDTWAAAGKFLDLADFVTFMATDRDVRSLCTNVCKWTYLGHESRWDPSYFQQIGLEDLFDGDRVGENIRPMGELAGYLTPEAAGHLGLTEKTAVGVGIIDAHAGGIGAMGSVFEEEGEATLDKLERVLALIGGTSTCHMAVSQEPRFIDGVWGPYYSAMIPGMWLTEGGQGATGSLIDYVIYNHGLRKELLDDARDTGLDVYQFLNELVAEAKQSEGKGAAITKDLHVLPYHHGNRSPRADAFARGIVDGLTLDISIEPVALLYYAHVQAIAYGTRHILDALTEKGYSITQINACGGGSKNALWLQEHADITGRDIHLPKEPEAVLLGSAILGAVAAGEFASIPEAMKAMCHKGEVIRANPADCDYHDAKYKLFLEMYEQQLARRRAMEGF